mmetsp:Transcript_83256/g.144667  ORF Transcript_83256/g.144667 Transcript_83256/m.144667 type:complete len:84 (-) Transcript_83256:193-444(-)
MMARKGVDVHPATAESDLDASRKDMIPRRANVDIEDVAALSATLSLVTIPGSLLPADVPTLPLAQRVNPDLMCATPDLLGVAL